MALRQMIDKKKHFFIYLLDFVQFLPGMSFVDCPTWDKICEIMTKHPHLLTIGDDSKVTSVNSFFAGADGPKLRKPLSSKIFQECLLCCDQS